MALSCEELARQMPAPPQRLNRVRDLLLRIRRQLERDRGDAALTGYLRGGQAPSKLNRHLRQLQEQLRGLNRAAAHELRQALDDALWGDPPTTTDEHRVIVRPYNAVPTRGAMEWQPGTVISGHDMPPLFEIVDQAISLAIERLEERSGGNPGAIGRAGRRAARRLIKVYRAVHNGPEPVLRYEEVDGPFDVELRPVVDNPEPAQFALDCLVAWGHPGAQDIGVTNLVASLEGARKRARK